MLPEAAGWTHLVAGLGHAVCLEHRSPVGLLAPFQQRGRQRRTARADEPQGARRAVVVGPVQDHLMQRRAGRQPGRAGSRAWGQNRRGVNRRGAMTAPPAPSAANVDATRPWMWNSGITQNDTSAGPAGNARRSCAPRPSGCAAAAEPAWAGWWCRWCAGRARHPRLPGSKSAGASRPGRRQQPRRAVRRRPDADRVVAVAAAAPGRGRAAGRNQQQPGRDVVQEEAELGLGVRRVQRCCSGAKSGDGQQQQHDFRAVRQCERDAVAARGRQPREPLGEASTRAATCAYVSTSALSGTMSAGCCGLPPASRSVRDSPAARPFSCVMESPPPLSCRMKIGDDASGG